VSAVLCLSGLGGGTALGLETVVTQTPLPGSQFQGGDGNQDDAPSLGYIDWQGLQLDGRVEHVSDPNARDDIFGGGSKELEPGQWTLTTTNGGASPGSANILDTYASLERPPGGSLFAYLAFARFASTGTIYLTFELNQDPRSWTNPRGATIPCRTTNDILISYEPHGSERTIVKAGRWVTTQAAANGCALTGRIEETDLSPEVAQAAFNGTSDINNYLPGFYPIGSATLPLLRFGEAAINLSSVVAGLGQPCLTFFSTWAHSRSSSQSETSNLVDYVAPHPLRLDTCPGEPALSSVALGTARLVHRAPHHSRRRSRPRPRHRALRHGRHHRRAPRAHRASTSRRRLRRSAPRVHRSVRHVRLSPPTPAGAPLWDVAHLSGGNHPTGAITFKLYGPNDATCAGPPIFEFKATADGEGLYRSGEFVTTAAGTYHWVVSYAGDINNLAAGPTACDDEEETVIVGPAAPRLSTVASGAAARVHGRRRRHVVRAPAAIHDTAKLEGGVGPPAIGPTGKIIFEVYGPDNETCTKPPAATFEVAVMGNGEYKSPGFTPPRSGTYRWVAHYSGDDNNQPAGPTSCDDEAETVVVSPALPTLVTVASPTVTLNNPISDTATLTGGDDPSGTITFTLYGPDDENCNAPAADTSTVTVTGNGDYTHTFTPTAAGTYRWVAHYSGDNFNSPVGPTACDATGESVIVSPRTPSTHPALSSVASPSVPAGSDIHDVAVLSGAAAPVSGTITFRLFGPNDENCAAPAIFTTSVDVSDNGEHPSPPFTVERAGTYHWQVSYSGNEENFPAGPTACGESTENVVISRATPSLSTTASAGITLGESANDSAVLSGGANPTGTITFLLYGPDNPTCSNPPAFETSQAVTGNGTYPASFATPNRAGTYLWVAHYSGDSNNAPAESPCGASGETLVVKRAQPTLSTVAGVTSRRGVRQRVRSDGQSIYDVAILEGGFAPGGEITFSLYGPNNDTCSEPPIFTTATQVNGAGAYNSEAFTPTASGVYRWVAHYSGDANNLPAGGTACDDPEEQVSVIVPVDPHLSTTASQAVTLGGSISDTAHLSGGVDPTGTLTFDLFEPDNTTCTGTPLFTSIVPVNGNDDYKSASYTPTSAGVYRWVVHYSGDTHNHPAGPTGCGDASELSYVRPPSVTPVTPAFSTTASPPAQLGSPLSDVAHLSGGLDPAGSITFELFGPNDASCSPPPIFTSSVPVSGNGDYHSAQFVPPHPGAYRWVATYSGDALNTGAGPTACGESSETTSVSAIPGPNPDPGPNVTPPAPPKPAPPPKPHRRPRPRPTPPPPRFTG